MGSEDVPREGGDDVVSDAPDTKKSSAITDHPFEPRMGVHLIPGTDPVVVLPPALYLCQRCRLAEAAHAETTVER